MIGHLTITTYHLVKALAPILLHLFRLRRQHAIARQHVAHVRVRRDLPTHLARHRGHVAVAHLCVRTLSTVTRPSLTYAIIASRPRIVLEYEPTVLYKFTDRWSDIESERTE